MFWKNQVTHEICHRPRYYRSRLQTCPSCLPLRGTEKWRLAQPWTSRPAKIDNPADPRCLSRCRLDRVILCHSEVVWGKGNCDWRGQQCMYVYIICNAQNTFSQRPLASSSPVIPFHSSRNSHRRSNDLHRTPAYPNNLQPFPHHYSPSKSA